MFNLPLHIDTIASKCSRRERITAAEAITLYREAPLWLLSKLAAERKESICGDAIFYNRNFHIEPTNICRFKCRFCSYRRDAHSPEAWDYSIEEMVQMAQRYVDSGVTEVHIVGGVHPRHDLDFFVELIERVHTILPNVTIKAFTAVELAAMIKAAGLPLREGLERLQRAGMGAIPGGGAEIFTPEIRNQICPEKGSAEEWLEVHAVAHELGLSTNATILYGHIESLEDRVDHLDRLRRQQDLSGGFNAFIPLKYRSSHNEMSHLGEVSVVDDMRMMAISRLFLDNIPHLKAYWVMYGKATTELALAFGADDVDGTIDDSTKIYSMAGAEDQRPKITLAEIEAMAHRAGGRVVERDTHYNIIEGSSNFS
ncbi:MAG: CofH family radical SAM protein [Rikenellaceae bacterium]